MISKNNFVTNNSKHIHVHIMLQKFISNLRQDYEFSWVIENQMLVLLSNIKRLNLLNLKQGKRPNWRNYNIILSHKFY
jgi:hypothetical protein